MKDVVGSGSQRQRVRVMPFMCLTCSNRQEFGSSEGAVEHMTHNPFHQMVYYDDKSIDMALEKVKKNIDEEETDV